MYTLYNNSASPYGLKVSALIGYSGVACRLVTENIVNRFTAIRRLTGRTMIPVLRRGDEVIDDSTQIARRIMGESLRPMLPRDGNLVEMCWMLEDFADAWMARILMYSRWHTAVDCKEVSEIVGSELGGGLPWVSQVLGGVSERVTLKAVASMGVVVSNGDALEYSRERLLNSLESILSTGPWYLFEGYPTVADFAVYGVLGQYFRDPSGRVRAGEFPHLKRYLERLDLMCLPFTEVKVAAGQRSRDAQELQTLFAELMGTYWPLLVTNYRAVSARRGMADVGAGRGRLISRRRGKKKARKYARALMLDGSSFKFVPSDYLDAQFRWLLGLIEQAYLERDELFGEAGLRLESALVSHIAMLSRHQEGRELLRGYPNLGLH